MLRPLDVDIKNLNYRMVFTTCALVAKRYSAPLVKGMDYTKFHTNLFHALQVSGGRRESIPFHFFHHSRLFLAKKEYLCPKILQLWL